MTMTCNVHVHIGAAKGYKDENLKNHNRRHGEKQACVHCGKTMSKYSMEGHLKVSVQLSADPCLLCTTTLSITLVAKLEIHC